MQIFVVYIHILKFLGYQIAVFASCDIHNINYRHR